MSTKITDTAMSSDQTPHTATAWPVPGEPTLWSVTWLPGRALTRDQAVTAMTVAEIVAERAHVLADPAARLWWHMTGWAEELGLSAADAAQMAAAAPQAADDGPRANRDGEPCPVWCTTDHGRSYAATADGCELYYNVHGSDPIGSDSVPRVRLSLAAPGSPVEITVSAPGEPRLALDADKAEALAALVRITGPDGATLAEELRAAAAIARETAQ